MALYDVVVVGGGVAGLTSALYWAKEGARVVLFEASNQLGGLLATEKIRLGNHTFEIERFYHHFFKKDKKLKKLTALLGIEKSLKFYKVKSNLTSGTFYDKLILASLMLFPSYKPLVSVKIGDLFVSREQRERSYLYRLLKYKFYSYAPSISSAWLWARLHARFGILDVFKDETLGVFEPSSGVLLEALVRSLKDVGVIIYTLSPVDSLDEVISKYKPSRVVLTTPVHVAKKIVNGAIKWRWGIPSYISALNVVFFLKDPSYNVPYWINLSPSEKQVFLVKVNQHVLNRSLPVGVIYIGAYLPLAHKLISSPQTAVKLAYSLLTDDEKKKVIGHQIFSTPYAQHVPTVEYFKNIPPNILGKYKGVTIELFSFGNLIPWDRGVNHSIYNPLV